MLALSALPLLPAAGCIVADAPEYGSPQRSPIFVYNPLPANPASLQNLTSKDTTATPYGATTQSEDAGEQVVAIYVADYGHPNQRFLDTYTMPPYTFEQERQIRRYMTSQADFPQGINSCHTITLLVTHYSSWDQVNKRFVGPKEDLSSVTWFVAVDDDGSTLVSKCPTATTPPNP